MLEILYHRAKFGGARISPSAGAAKNVDFFYLSVCLSACLFVTRLNVRDCAPCFAMKALETGVQKRFLCRWTGEGL